MFGVCQENTFLPLSAMRRIHWQMLAQQSNALLSSGKFTVGTVVQHDSVLTNGA
uniref:Uncharacterized protein n=1 Tax=Anguilla anguilla TaxID=7936 RepID=A0A0E9RIU7_ANGAN